MSVKVMGLVWEADLPRDEKFILLSYADHADHNGDNVFPSVPLMAWKTGYSVRQIQRITKKLIEKEILIEVGESRYGTNYYMVDLLKLPERDPFKMKKRGRPKNGDILSLDEKNGDISDENGDTQDDNGDIAESYDPSLTIPKPPEDINKNGGVGKYICDLLKYPDEAVEQYGKAFEKERIAMGISEELFCLYAYEEVLDFPEIRKNNLIKNIRSMAELKPKGV
jgi:hypothetical protein